MPGLFSAVRVEGLADFQRSLKELDAGAAKALRVALNGAMDIIVDDARPRVPVRSGRARGSIKTSSTQNKARIAAGGTKARYFPWLDFGGKRRGRGGGIAERPFRRSGRYIWHSLARNRPRVVEGLEKAIVDVARQAGFEVS